MIILCDLDGIVADLLGEWLRLHNAATGESVTVDDIVHWDMHRCVSTGHRVYDVLQEPGLFRELLPLPGALETLGRFHLAGHRVVIVTAAAKAAQTAADKLSWIRQHLPWLDRKDVFIGHRKYLLRGDVLIDDSPTNILEYRAAWPKAAILTIDYPYNRAAEVWLATTFRAQSYAEPAHAWAQIEDYVTRLKGAT